INLAGVVVSGGCVGEPAVDNIIERISNIVPESLEVLPDPDNNLLRANNLLPCRRLHKVSHSLELLVICKDKEADNQKYGCLAHKSRSIAILHIECVKYPDRVKDVVSANNAQSPDRDRTKKGKEEKIKEK